jgi:putative colanic acid biosynthesis acetyltransferase WcaF
MNKKKLLNIQKCRNQLNYSTKEYYARILWKIFFPLFYYSPRVFFGWRRFLLRLFGAKVGINAHVYPTAYIYFPWNLILGEEASIGEWVLIYNLGSVKIGDRATISHRAHICAGTHDYQDSTFPLLRLPIEIGCEAWVCSDAFIGPNVKVGDGAIIGASSVVFKNIPAWRIVIGNPCKILKTRKIKKK